MNHAVAEILGYSREDLIGKQFIDSGMFPITSLSLIVKQFAESLTGKTHAPYMLSVKHKDGSDHVYEIRAHPILLNGRVETVQKVLRPISERSAIVTKLNQREAELQELNQFVVDQERKLVALQEENASLKKQLPQRS